MRPKFNLRVNASHRNIRVPNNKAEATILRRNTNNKELQLQEAVEWCLQYNARGYKALKTGMFPLIKDRETINRRLDGTIVTGLEKQYCSILTVAEEDSIVSFVKNKNRALQGINKADLTRLILDVLRIRDHWNRTKKGGRAFLKLSENAKECLTKNKYIYNLHYLNIIFKVWTI